MNTIATIPLSAMKKPAAPSNARWRVEDVEALFALPLMDVLHRAQQVYRQQFDPNEIQLSTLLSIKTGGCAEDCGYYPQSAHFDTDVKAGKLMPVAELVEAARTAKNQGAMRFCMGAAWRSPKPRDIAAVAELIRLLDRLGLRVQGEGAL